MKSPPLKTGVKQGAFSTPRWFFHDFLTPVEAFPAEMDVTDPETVRHLRTVLRVLPGEPITLVDAVRQVVYRGTILEPGRHAVRVRLEACEACPPEPGPVATLAAALIKEQRWDVLLQKATELGVRTFQPLLAEHGVVVLREGDYPRKLARWQQVVRSAAGQCESRFIPEILPPLTVQEYVRQLPPPEEQTLYCLLKERGENRPPLKQRLSGIQAGTIQSILFAVGPEGGWTDREMGLFEESGFLPCSLGSRVLRSETAALVAMAALMYEVEASLK